MSNMYYEVRDAIEKMEVLLCMRDKRIITDRTMKITYRPLRNVLIEKLFKPSNGKG